MKVTAEQIQTSFQTWITEWQRVPAARAAAETLDMRTVDPATFAAAVTPYFVDLLKRAGADA